MNNAEKAMHSRGSSPGRISVFGNRLRADGAAVRFSPVSREP
jgi:hypothetical protein